MSIQLSVTFFGLSATCSRLGGCTCIHRVVGEIGQLKIGWDCMRGNVQHFSREADVFFVVHPLSAVLWPPGHSQGHCGRVDIYPNEIVGILNLEMVQCLFDAFPKDPPIPKGWCTEFCTLL